MRITPSTADTAVAGACSKDTLNRQGNNHKHRQSTLSISSLNQNRTRLFTLVAVVREKTTNAIANLSESSVRSQLPSTSAHRSGQSLPTSASHYSKSLPKSADAQPSSRDNTDSSNTAVSSLSHARAETADLATSGPLLLQTNPPSRASSNTATDPPAPITFTSSRVLRMTSDGRPFTRDFEDLFATLVVSLPLKPHRIRLTRVDHSFLSKEAINNLGSLKFSQSNRMLDPKDPSRIVTTTTTTTFSIARYMAGSMCQRFLDASFIESADSKQAKEFNMKGSVWRLTPKGINQKHITELVSSLRNTMQLVILERDSATNKPSSDRSTVKVIFRRFVGRNGPNVTNSTSSADSDSLSEYKDGRAGVRMVNERKVGSPLRTVYQTFTGKAATDWLMDCCTAVDRRETAEIATLFLEQELIWCVQSDRSYLAQLAQDKKNENGKDVVNITSRERASENAISSATTTRAGSYKIVIKANSLSSGKSSSDNLDSARETMASAYGIYNAFLAAGSPCELNIDHSLRNQLAIRMTKAAGQDAPMIESLTEVTRLLEEAQLSVFELMASDSVPKFMQSSKYEQTLKNYDFDSISPRHHAMNLLDRSMSGSNR
ncbi:regulator of G protein-like protein [Halenospora varia]|nr:regulator of G protein-like protein [Halenospora varia]